MATEFGKTEFGAVTRSKGYSEPKNPNEPCSWNQARAIVQLMAIRGIGSINGFDIYNPDFGGAITAVKNKFNMGEAHVILNDLASIEVKKKESKVTRVLGRRR